ncbi:MAG: restriction endonuclease subunit S [Halopseudomonas sp.]
MSTLKLNLDKSDWTPVKFGDVAFEPKESVKDARAEGIEHIIGLEHINSEDIHLRRSNGINESTTFTKKFSEGDVLFGRRRAYLRKAAQASFEGICSGDITVMRAKENLLPELLPFIVNNDKFFDWAVTHSAGGLSPRCKFKDLANYEFLLPPKELQTEVAELLWGMDEVIGNSIQNKIVTNALFETSRNSIFCPTSPSHPLNICNDNEHNELGFKSLIDGKTLNGIYKPKEFQGQGVRIINMGELFAYPIIEDEEMSLIQLTDKEKCNFLVEEGDLIFARRSLVVEGAGKCSIIGKHSTPMTFESSMIRARVDTSKINPKYIFHFLKSKEGQRRIRRIVCFTTVAGITSSDLANVKIPYVSFKRQNAIVEHLDSHDNVFNSLDVNINNSKALNKSLINQVF